MRRRHPELLAEQRIDVLWCDPEHPGKITTPNAILQMGSQIGNHRANPLRDTPATQRALGTSSP